MAGPILERRDFHTVATDDAWPRVWWIVTGALSNFPIYAAGYHKKGLTNTVLDRVMSTYCSSFKTLIHSRRKKARKPKQAPSVNTAEGRRQGQSMGAYPSGHAVVVAMPVTPGSTSALPFAAEEAETIKKTCLSMVPQLDVIQPACLHKEVLEQLPGCEVFHYADMRCRTNWSRPKAIFSLRTG